jgi:hypothetical protein
MSLLKSNSVQIGQSTTGTNNFTLSVPSSPDGTIKLARGNSGATTADILTVDASGNVTTTLANGSISASKLSGAQSGSAPIYGARAWCRFNGTTTGTNAPTAGGNVSTVARTATGTYTITFATAMEDANYCIQANATYTTIVDAGTYVISTSTSSCVVGHAESNAVADTAQMHVLIFR